MVVLAPAKQAVVENGEATMDGNVQQIPENLYAHAFVPTAGKRMTVAQVSPAARGGKASVDIATVLERLRGSAGTIEPQVSMRLTAA